MHQRLWICVVAMALLCATPWSRAQSRFQFETTPGRLSKDVRPAHYQLHFDLDPALDVFKGQETIRLHVLQDQPDLVLHAHELEATEVTLSAHSDKALPQAPRVMTVKPDAATQTWRLTPQDGRPIVAGRYALHIRYSGRVNKVDAGLYRASYTYQGQSRDMLATQLEAVFARKLFPGFDEPSFRSVFEISVKAPPAYAVYSNMPARVTRDASGQRSHRFQPTPAMPTYLVALTVGQLDVLHGRAGQVPLRMLTAAGKRDQARYALDVTKKVVPFYASYFGIDYALPKLDQLAVPSARGGAMEDWGLISYAETALLFNPANSDPRRRREVFSTVAHEVAHQWFGNLVTAASWEEIWLNEAFATWMAEKATDHFNPQWWVSLRRRQPIDQAMVSDASSATRAIRSGPVSEDRVFDVFDGITYTKGGAVLSMLEGWLGPEVFRKGLSAYMKQRQFSNATAADLWFHIGQAAGRDVTSVARTWTDQKGFPLVTVNAQCDAGHTRLDVRQRRFATDAQAADGSTWAIPLTVWHQGKVHQLLMDQAQQSFTWPGCHAATPWVNVSGQGFYRVQYDPQSYATLVNDFAALPATGQITLLSDSFALFQAGQLSLASYFALLDQVPVTRGPGRAALLDRARTSLDDLDEIYAQTPVQATLRTRARALLAPELTALGWSVRPDDSSEVQLLRNGLILSLAGWGDQAILDQAGRLFDQEEASGAMVIPVGIRDSVIRAAGLGAGASRHGRLVQRLLSANSEEDRWRYADAVAAVRDPALAMQVLELSLNAPLPNNVASNLPQLLSRHGVHSLMAYQFVKDHYAELANKAGEMFGASSWLLPGAASHFHTTEMSQQLLHDQDKLVGDKGAQTAAKVAARIRLKAALRLRETSP